MTAQPAFFVVHVPRRWLRLLHIGEPLIEARWGAVYYGGAPTFVFTPVTDVAGSLVAGEAQFPDKIASAFWSGSKRAAICPRQR